ncbi:NAD(P)-dependent oxidoreductase [Chroococcus sp. FPU101]|uniref:NAD(P)-dependent oxidoreductase n=1 Tax=Chroococcus sp. FPU101 TaxID=1974212 RepID=UPI001A90B25F|nr:NAD(P)-dependent oxidoreductase [Chroococcus sp. FPU101]
MIKRLLSSEFPVIAYNRTSSKLDVLKEFGVTVAQSPKEVVQNSDCIILMLTNAAAIRELLLSESASDLNERTIIQMGTIAPQESRTLAQEIIFRGGEYLEAPVLGSIPEAEKGKLLVMVGGTENQFKKWSVLLQHFGTEPILIGEVGTAAALKLALNQLIASLTSSFALSLAFLECQGVDIEKFMGILRQSALYAPTFDKKLERMCEHNYDNPNFPTKHLLKDVNLFLQESESLNLMSNSLNGVQKILDKAIELGLADADYSALYSAITPKE